MVVMFACVMLVGRIVFGFLTTCAFLCVKCCGLLVEHKLVFVGFSQALSQKRLISPDT